MKSVLVYSATGVQASPLLSLLQEVGYRTYAMTRNRSTAKINENELVSISETDISNAHQLEKANEGMDVVMLNLPFFSDDNAGKYAIEAAQNAGVKLIIWNANGAVPQETSTRYKMNTRMENMERLVASGIPYVVFQPTMYLENLLLPGTAEGIRNRDTIEMVAPSMAPIPWMSTHDICRAMVSVITREDLRNQVLTVSGAGITGTQLANEFSRALGRTIQYHQVEMTEYINRLNQVMGEGKGEEIMGMGKEDTRTIRTANFPNFSALNAFEKLEFYPISIENWVQHNKQQF
ncbi:MAG: NmrA family NAD(P)-binding protein [Bacteroidota bacterium]